MPGGEMMKGLVDVIANCRLFWVVSGNSVSHLVDFTVMAVVTNERQLWSQLGESVSHLVDITDLALVTSGCCTTIVFL